MATTEVKVGEWLSRGFELYKENFATLLGSTAVAIILSVVTMGILAGPLLVGVLLICLRLLDQDPDAPEISDIFKGFDQFLPAFLFCLCWFAAIIISNIVLGFLPFIGGLLSMVVQIVLQTSAMFGLALIADKKLDFVQASKAVIALLKADPVAFSVYLLTVGVIGTCGIFLLMVGMFFTAPFTIAAVAVAYRQYFPMDSQKLAEFETGAPESGKDLPPQAKEVNS